MSRYLWVTLTIAVSLEMLELVHMAYESGAEWHALSALLTERLAISYGVVQVLIGSACPFVLLLLAIQPRLNPRWMTAISATASALVLVQVFAMRWNVVVGGQMLSNSFRGFVDYPLHMGGREGLIAAAVILVLPFVALIFASRLLPLWQTEEIRRTGNRSYQPPATQIRDNTTTPISVTNEQRMILDEEETADTDAFDYGAVVRNEQV